MDNLKVENYVKAIYQICAETESITASTGEIASRLQLTPGSVTSMLGRLKELGLAKYKAHQGVRLSDRGEELALRILRRHRLIELFLAKTLGLSWDEIHAEAENIEHAVSDRLVDRIDEFLGRPDRDPHGDPIPNSDGSLRTVPGEPLTEFPSRTKFVLERVLDQSPEFLRYLSDGGLAVGSSAVVEQNNPTAGVLTIRTEDRLVNLGHEVADKLLGRRL